jgi:hypothetical protein
MTTNPPIEILDFDKLGNSAALVSGGFEQRKPDLQTILISNKFSISYVKRF